MSEIKATENVYDYGTCLFLLLLKCSKRVVLLSFNSSPTIIIMSFFQVQRGLNKKKPVLERNCPSQGPKCSLPYERESFIERLSSLYSE